MNKVNWPSDDNLAMQFSELSDAVREVVDHCYTLRRKNKKKDVDWKGPDLPKCMGATGVEFSYSLSANHLKWVEEDQDDNAMNTIIQIAIQLGIEQGRRMYKNEIKNGFSILDNAKRNINDAIFLFKGMS